MTERAAAITVGLVFLLALQAGLTLVWLWAFQEDGVVSRGWDALRFSTHDPSTYDPSRYMSGGDIVFAILVVAVLCFFQILLVNAACIFVRDTVKKKM